MALCLLLLLSILLASTYITKAALWATHWFWPQKTWDKGTEETSCSFHSAWLWTPMIYYKTCVSQQWSQVTLENKIKSELGEEVRWRLQNQSKLCCSAFKSQRVKNERTVLWCLSNNINTEDSFSYNAIILNFYTKEIEENYHLNSHSWQQFCMDFRSGSV